MKKPIVITVLLVAGLTMTCNDYLDVDPVSEISTATFYASESGALAAIAAAYDPLQWGGSYKTFMWTLNDIGSDDADKGDGGASDGPQWIQVDNFNYSAENDEILNGYVDPYAGILRANVTIEQVPGIDMDEELKQRIVGEAKFLRALYYFNLVNSFGGVPLITEVLPLDELIQPRATALEVWNQIAADLDSAQAVLPAVYDDENLGRATKGAALGLLAKSHVFLAHYDPANAASHWQKAVENAQAVIDLGVYQLVDGATPEEKQAAYRTMFTAAGDNNVESVFEVQFARIEGQDGWGNQGDGHWHHAYMGLRGDSGQKGNTALGTAGFGFDMPSLDLVDAYEAGDIRLGATIVQTGDEFRGFVLGGDELGNTSNGTLPRKYLNEDPSFAADGINQPMNLKVLRYSDILLLLAEALNEVNGSPTAAAYEAINQVRERASLPTLAGLDQAAFREAVWQERRVEFALEGMRWFDLKRQGDGSGEPRWLAVMRAHVEEYKNEDITIAPYNELLPIPQAAIDNSGGVLTQNEGY